MKLFLAILSIILINILFKTFDFGYILNLNSLEYKILTKSILFILSLSYLFFFFRTPKKFFLKNNNSYIFLGIISIIIFYLSLDNTFNNHNKLLKFISSCLLTGSFEELFFRVFVFLSFLDIFSQKNLFKNIYLSSLFFGLIHLSNLFSKEIIALSVIAQVIFASVIGLFLFSLLIKTKNIIVPIIVHTAINYYGSFNKILNDNEVVVDYDINNFISSLIFILIISIILIPISLLLIKSEIKTWHNIVYK
tara:strand:- start:465 stop:1214 length:750 start_codon:yes stop_codon:yes gene_type:complete